MYNLEVCGPTVHHASKESFLSHIIRSCGSLSTQRLHGLISFSFSSLSESLPGAKLPPLSKTQSLIPYYSIHLVLRSNFLPSQTLRLRHCGYLLRVAILLIFPEHVCHLLPLLYGNVADSPKHFFYCALSVRFVHFFSSVLQGQKIGCVSLSKHYISEKAKLWAQSKL